MTITLIKTIITTIIIHIAPLPEDQCASNNLQESNEKLHVKIADYTAKAEVVYI